MPAVQFIFYFLSLTALLLGFQNCGSAFTAEQSSTLSSSCKVTPNSLSPFDKDKIQMNHFKNSFSQKLTATTYKASLVIDTQCSSQQAEDLIVLDQKIEKQPIDTNIKKKAIDIVIPANLSKEELSLELTNKPCVIGLADNLDVKKTQTLQASSVNDPQASQQRHLDFVGFYESQRLQSEITSKVIVAVIDTGVDYNHLDLRNRMWDSRNGIPGVSFVSGVSDVLDDDGHGTHVAGIIAAEQNNSFGVSGLLDSFVEIMAIKSLNADGSGTSQAIYNGVQYALANGADVINLSLEAPGQNALMEDALNDAVEAGVVVTVAAGNQSTLMTANNLFAPAYIGEQLDGVMTVASVDTETTDLSPFSNYSNLYAEMAAPGSERPGDIRSGILSTMPFDRWARTPGTSQASPMVASAAALVIGFLKTNNVNYSAGAIERFLKVDGAGINPILANRVQGGRIVRMDFLSRNLDFYKANGLDESDFSGEGTGRSSCQF
ncbi:MAG: S8 family serine peptidase [Pseudomonadota bacterium]